MQHINSVKHYQLLIIQKKIIIVAVFRKTCNMVTWVLQCVKVFLSKHPRFGRNCRHWVGIWRGFGGCATSGVQGRAPDQGVLTARRI